MRTHLLITLAAIAMLSHPPPANAQTSAPPTVAVEDLDINNLCASIYRHRNVRAYGRTFAITRSARAGSYLLADVEPIPPANDTAATIVLERRRNGTCRDVALAAHGELTPADLQRYGVPTAIARALFARFQRQTANQRP
jgi:hypothetical protein